MCYLFDRARWAGKDSDHILRRAAMAFYIWLSKDLVPKPTVNKAVERFGPSRISKYLREFIISNDVVEGTHTGPYCAIFTRFCLEEKVVARLFTDNMHTALARQVWSLLQGPYDVDDELEGSRARRTQNLISE